MSPRALRFALGLLTAACASGPRPTPTPVAAPHPSACVITTDSAGPLRPILAAFDDSSNAAHSRLAATRVAPVRLDCEGRATPGLATRWSRDTSGKFWTLELPPPAGPPTPATPRWTAGSLAATWAADPDASATLRGAGARSASPLDDQRLVVGFVESHPDLPAVFADRALAVARGDSGMLREAQPSSGDLRDAVDGRADVVVTGDPDLLDYAVHRQGLAVIPLPWSRTYYLVILGGSSSLGTAIPSDTAAFRAALARDAVRTDARPVDTTMAADAADRCRSSAGSARPAPTDVILYPLADPTARELAERIVALAALARFSSRGQAPESLAAALDRGEARAFIVPGGPRSAGPCADWTTYPAGAAILPLIETRRHAIVRRGTPPLVAEWDGAVRVAESRDTAGATE